MSSELVGSTTSDGLPVKSLLINILKFMVAAGLIAYLVSSGKLDFAQLSIYFEDTTILVSAIAVWALLFVGLGSVRWYLLLIGLKLPVVFRDVLRLQCIGIFFNSVMPGAVGGDLIKAIYVVRGQSSAGKTTAMLSIVVDRVCGLMGMFVFSWTVVLVNFSFVWDIVALRPFVLIVTLVFIGIVAGFLLALLPSDEKDWVGNLLSKPIVGFGLLKRIYVAFRSYRDHPSVLLYSVVISVINQASVMILYWLVASKLIGTAPAFGAFATVVPIGLLISALPIAPAGIGVGHVAFENLLKLVGVEQGANVFNVVTLGMLVLNLLGAIPYLSHRGSISVKGAHEH